MAASPESILTNPDTKGVSVDMLAVGYDMSEANAFQAKLRNAGMAVHTQQAQDSEQLNKLLASKAFELVLIDADTTDFDPAQAITVVRSMRKDAAVILLAADPAKSLELAITSGARDVVAADDSARLVFVAHREMQWVLLRKELRQHYRKLNEIEHRCDTLIESSRDAIAYIHEGMHVHANLVYATQFGYDDETELEGLPVMDLVHPDDQGRFKEILKQLEKDDYETQSVELSCMTADGQAINTVLEFSPATIDGEPCTQVLIRDQGHQAELQERIAELASRDSQTGLFNRHYCMERLESAIAAMTEDGPAQIFLQISVANFKQIRGQTGVELADRMLQEIAGVLQSVVKEPALVARFGDHDFSVLHPVEDNPTGIAEDILDALSSHVFEATDQPTAPEYAIGVASSHDPLVASAHELINRALQARNEAEDKGANKIVAFMGESALAAAAEYDAATIELIDQALESDRFCLKYQPIVSLQGDTRENYAVTVRLLDQDDKEVLPENFLPDAESANRSAEIDRWVIRNAIKELVKQRQEGRKINFFITLSAPGSADDSLLLWICDCLREFRAKGAWLVFQLRMENVLELMDPVRQLLEGLKRINCRVAIEHYVETDDTEALFKHLPIDFVKLSEEFMGRLANDASQQERIREVNDKLQALDLKTVATHVEDANSLAALWTTGINYIQGNFLQEPSSTINYDFED